MPTSVTDDYWNAVASSVDVRKLVAVSGARRIYRSANSGLSWADFGAPTTNWYYVASSADGNKLYAVGGGQLYTWPFATTWAATSAPLTNWSYIASSVDGSKLVAVAGGNFGFGAQYGPAPIYSSTNSGATWRATSAPDEYWYSVASSADGIKLVAVAGGSSASGPIYTSTNSGTTWMQSSAPSTNWQAVASSSDGAKLVAAAYAFSNGAPATIYISVDSGGTWWATAAPDRNWQAVASSADGSKLAAVASGGEIFTLQTTLAPLLNITRSDTNIVLSWTVPSVNFVLQENADLATTNW